jgi:hypothetical protein
MIYTTIILPVLYGFVTWSLILREELRLKVFENRVLRIIFGSRRVEMEGKWRKLNNEEFNDLYFSPNIVRVIKSRRTRWAEHVASMEIVEVHTSFWVGNRRERDYLEDPNLDGILILSRMFRKWDGERGLD